MAKSSANPKLSLKFLIDRKKNKVVLAEAGNDFVDVLCSLLTLPMGTIVRLLEKKHQSPQSSIVGCFHNLYRSVSDMNVDNFETQACKNLLLYPRSIKESQCRRLKLNIDDTEATKFFICHRSNRNKLCCKVYSNISKSWCHCGNLMTEEFKVQGAEQANGSSGDRADGAFLSCRTSFIITDDLKVALNSMGLVLNVLNDLGYSGLDQLQEMLLDVGFEEVLTLLECLLTSETPLTDTFLRKDCMTRKRELFTPLVQESGVVEDGDKFLTIKVYVRKTDRAVLYAECSEDFVDCLFTFLAIPLEFAWELSINDVKNMGCVGNLCTSVKDLSFEKQKEATVSKCMLPYYYNIGAQLLDIVIQKGTEYECLVSSAYPSVNFKFSRKIKKDVLFPGESIVKLTPMDPKVGFGSSNHGRVSFVKRETNFIVSDDLKITPMNASSTITILSKFQMKISDIDEQVVYIGKEEAVSLLRASLTSTSALTNGLSNFL